MTYWDMVFHASCASFLIGAVAGGLLALWACFSIFATL